ncbi:MAG: MFS transporter [Candidatus Shapirobacteria bacterium]
MTIDKNIRLYYFASIFEGLRFLLPIWLIWYTRFLPMSTVGLIESLGIILTMFLEVPTGAFADIFGRRTSVIIGKIGVATAAFIVAFASNGSHLIVGSILWGISGAFISGASTALIYDHLLSIGQENNFPKVISMSTTISRVGIIIGSFFGGYLFNIWAPLPYFLFGITNLVELVIWLFIKEPLIDSQNFSWVKYQQKIANAFVAISHSSKIRLISLISVTTISSAFIFREYYNYSFALDLGLNAQDQSFLFGVSGILKMLSVMAIGGLIIKYSQEKIIYTYFLSFIFVLLPTIISGYWGGIIIILLIELISATAPIISDSYLNKELPSADRATSISFINMFSSLTNAIGISLGLYFIGIVKSPMVYTIFGIFLLIISGIFFIIQNKQRVVIK